jgi:FkbM family methyltransferase
MAAARLDGIPQKALPEYHLHGVSIKAFSMCKSCTSRRKSVRLQRRFTKLPRHATISAHVTRDRSASAARLLRSALQASVALVPWRARTLIKRVPLAASLQRWLLSRFVEGHPFVCTLDAGPARGLRYRIRLPEDKPVWTGTYELPFASAVARAVRPDFVCFDVGGYGGYYAGLMALAGARKVLVFEPLPENACRVRDLCELNPALPIELHQLALGQHQGSADFLVMPHSTMAKLASSPFLPGETPERTVTVPVTTVDSLVSSGQAPPPNLLKLDIEGAELQALRGAEQTLRAHKPRLFIEVHSSELARDCRALLETHGYQLTVTPLGDNPESKAVRDRWYFSAE